MSKFDTLIKSQNTITVKTQNKDITVPRLTIGLTNQLDSLIEQNQDNKYKLSIEYMNFCNKTVIKHVGDQLKDISELDKRAILYQLRINEKNTLQKNTLPPFDYNTWYGEIPSTSPLQLKLEDVDITINFKVPNINYYTALKDYIYSQGSLELANYVVLQCLYYIENLQCEDEVIKDIPRLYKFIENLPYQQLKQVIEKVDSFQDSIGAYNVNTNVEFLMSL